MYTKNPDRTNWGIRNLILIWVVLALGVVCWTNPNFWMDSVDYFKKAQKAADRGDYENAMIQIETAIIMEPENSGYLVTKGFFLMDSGSPAAATRIFQDVLDLDPGNREARFGMAEIFFQNEKVDEAVDARRPADVLDEPGLGPILPRRVVDVEVE